MQPEATLIAKGEGAWLETADGRRIFDAISSWWVVTLGNRHPHIVQAIKDQADRLNQVIFAGLTHESAEKLERQLIAVTPPALEYVFFDSGSTLVEVALALGFWRYRGEKRSRILALEGVGRLATQSTLYRPWWKNSIWLGESGKLPMKSNEMQ